MKYLVIILTLLSITACASGPRQDTHPRFVEERPRSVLILPPANHSTAALASEHYRTTLAVPLARAGYYVFSTEVTNLIMREEGIVDGAQLQEVDPARFHQLFGADTILQTTIHQWDTSYYVIGGGVTVSVSFDLVSTHTGNTLWSHSDRRVADTTSRNQSSLLGALLETALNTAQQDYMPLARELSHDAFARLPYGVYHPRYQPLVEYVGEPMDAQEEN